ncbi:MAG: phosphoglycerate kinase [Dehalococcoidales bacterium]|nr:phosphoglycerate kinase [Dehalococcoidales bacterium]
MNKETIQDIKVSHRRVLVRVDFNVPLDEKGQVITDDSRIKATLPTINYLVDHHARIILCSHLGRPRGRVIEKLRLGIVAQHLSRILGRPVKVARQSIGPEVQKAVAELKEGDILLLENIRFYPEEEQNDTSFAHALASLADIYVNDAFGTSHRTHASVVGVTKYLPSVAGLLLKKEIETLGNLLQNPDHPFGLLLGGAKISDKISMIENTMDKVDYLLIGGGMAATFLKAKSFEIGLSLIEENRLEVATRLIKRTLENGVRLLLPIDVVVADEISPKTAFKVVSILDIPRDKRIVDLGPKTIDNFRQILQKCRTVFWNGPMGIYELPQFAEGTKSIVRVMANLHATTIIGGGSTAEIAVHMGLANRMTFVSTGGGASLKFLGGEVLPGVEALSDKELR